MNSLKYVLGSLLLAVVINLPFIIKGNWYYAIFGLFGVAAVLILLFMLRGKIR